ncbi:sulfatase [Thermostaphylospora chromogena]|uniref:Phosphoglycerol transferase MdoB n=1 Tax=Thermostaphylospora chromogena TaxID=35622 RepID=A0A1H1EV67_9ACTN|nr:sulfatase [Thermostaphylospora chromogena]SDQ92647.1 hypothetical protein SAMN04489764_2646 [Thermostaphylospora chromogena]
MVTILACLPVMFALAAPVEATALTPAAFLRIPVEAVLGAAVLLVLPSRARRTAATGIGVVLGLLAIVKLFDLGFFAVLARPFSPVYDWTFFAAAAEFLDETAGRAGTVAAVAAVALLAVGVVVLMTRSVLRLVRVAARHRGRASGVIAVSGAVWVVCAVSGTQIVPGVPVAGVAYDRLLHVEADLYDDEAFAAEAAADAFRDTPGEDLLTALRGKDVVFVFVESYGRDAIENPEYAPHVGAVLTDGERRLREAGFSARSGFLTSPTAGGGSWLAHATLLSGLWIDNQQRYATLVAGDRLTLNGAFRRAGWRTVGVMPGVTRAWPEGEFYGYDRVYAARDLGYRGPGFSWGTIPDQYTLAAFERFERAGPASRDGAVAESRTGGAEPGAAAAGRGSGKDGSRGEGRRPPVMAEIPLVSSHAPWVPIPELIDWGDVGDGSVFRRMAGTGPTAEEVWGDFGRVRVQYRRAVEYSLRALFSYVERYGDDDLVLVFLGDHQPAPLITGIGASRDVPITIVTRDRAVLDRISGWGWHEGVRPGADAPVWPMDAFRDRFLTAFGPQPVPS